MGDTPFTVPDNMKESVAAHAPFMKRQMFKFLASSAEGKSVFKEKTFSNAAEIVRFLNENKLTVILHAVLPDFNSCRYIVLFEEEAK